MDCFHRIKSGVAMTGLGALDTHFGARYQPPSRERRGRVAQW